MALKNNLKPVSIEEFLAMSPDDFNKKQIELNNEQVRGKFYKIIETERPKANRSQVVDSSENTEINER
jgi:hypothetical protein